MKVSVVNSAPVAASVGTMELTLFMAIMQVYAGDKNCCLYVGFEVVLSVTGMLVDFSAAIYAGDCFFCNYEVRTFCNTYAGGSFCIEYVGDNFNCNYADGSLLQLCRWYFLQWIMHMTIFIEIMQVTLSEQLCR